MKVFSGVLVKFGASWCNPCNQAEKYLEQNFKGQYESVDVMTSEDVAQAYNVKNVPTFIAFNKQGDIVDRFTGFNPKAIKEAIAKI